MSRAPRPQPADAPQPAEEPPLSVQAFMDAIPNPVFYTDREGRYLGCNRAFEAFFGLPRQAILGKTPLELFADADLARVYHDKNLELLGRPGVQVYETRARQADGRMREIESHKAAYLGADGRVAGLVGVMVDISEARRLEQELQASEARFRAIAECTYNWENWVDASGKLRWVSPAVERIAGYTPAECYAMEDFPLALAHPEDRGAAAAWFAAAKAGRQGRGLQHRLVRKDGRVIWVEVSHQAAVDASGAPIGHRSSLRDISDLKAASAELFAAQQMLQLVLDHIPQRVFWKDRDSRYLGANRAYLDDLGLACREEIVGKSDWELPISPNAELYFRDDQQVMADDAPKLGIEEPLVLPDGRDHWLLTNKVPLHDDQGRVIGVLGAYTDIAEQRATQARLEEALHQLKAIVNNAQVGIGFFQNHRLIWINPAMEQMFGFPLDEARAGLADVFFPGTTSFEQLGNEAYPVMMAGKVFEQELRLRRRGGEGFWVHVRGSAIEPRDITRGSIWTVLDIDAQKRAMAQLQELNATLAQRVEEETAKSLQNEHLLMAQARHAAMGEMIGNIAHQWRQPLSSLGLVIQNLRYDFKEGRLQEADLDAYVAKAMRAIEQMTGTIDDFRDFFRPTRKPENFRPVAAIRGCHDLVGASLRANNIDLVVRGPEDLELFGFAREFSQIVLNLIANAKDAMVERKVAAGRIDIEVRRGEGEVLVTVRDNAGGIAAGNLEKIFDPYFTTKEKGTGIGLYMSRTIVEQHMRGTITAANANGGAMFVIALPDDLAGSP